MTDKKARDGSIQNDQPRLIQRCFLDREQKKLGYDYMGSTEFEIGDQYKSLQRIFAGEIRVGSCTVNYDMHKKQVRIFMVARSDFDFTGYVRVLTGLVNRLWRTKERTYLAINIERHLGIDDDPSDNFGKVDVWFDFKNDVLFTLTQENVDDLLAAFDGIRKSWREREEFLNSKPVVKFRNELEQIKQDLRAAGKRWISLNRIERRQNGRLVVWLNPLDQQKYYLGWYSLKTLRAWVHDRGAIVKKKETLKQEVKNNLN